MRIPRSIAAVALLALLLPAGLAAGPLLGTDVGFTDGRLSYVATVPVDVGTAIDAVVHDDHLYVTTWRGFSVYDVSDPLDPQLLHTELTGPHLINENPQTNGEILLLSDDSNRRLHIWDVTDPSSPSLITTYRTTRGDHIWTCVLGCTYAYSSHGTILDLTDPADPVDVGDWRTARSRPFRNFHHIAEVAPGMVLVGALPVAYLDAREDPRSPELVAEVEPPSRTYDQPYVIIRGHSPSLPARVDWPLEATDDFALVSMETPFSGDCQDGSGTFVTFATEDWEETGTFTQIDEWALPDNGTYLDGTAPANFFGCTTYGFQVAPTYDDQRTVAVSAFEHGVRLLEVDEDGAISESGWFVPAAGASAAVRWIDEDVLYSIDLHRGIDILRVSPEG